MFLVESFNRIYVLRVLSTVLSSVIQDGTVGITNTTVCVLLTPLMYTGLYLSQEDVPMEDDSSTVGFASILQF
jgi:hypothetical protein